MDNDTRILEKQPKSLSKKRRNEIERNGMFFNGQVSDLKSVP